MSGIDWLLDTNLVIGLLKGHDAAMALAEEQKDAIIAATALMPNAQLLTLDHGMSRALGKVVTLRLGGVHPLAKDE
ncbi:MAG: hypothetical protein HQL63_08040 [Magnetococcales bacterium]|nr:hypothetical protein [Magnetococcales bacterium]